MTRRNLLAVGAGAMAALPRLRAANLPRLAPELAVTLSNGEQVLLSKHRGKVVMLEVLLTTCPHCQRCASVMQKMVNEYGSKGVAALGAAVNDGARGDLTRFLSISGAKFPIGIAEREAASHFILAERPPVYFPQLVLIDRKGMIRHQFRGDDEFFLDEEKNLRRLLQALLAEGPARTSSTKGAAR